MKFFSALLTLVKKPQKGLRSIDDYKQEALIQQGKAQFENLLQRGLTIPVAIL